MGEAYVFITVLAVYFYLDRKKGKKKKQFRKKLTRKKEQRVRPSAPVLSKRHLFAPVRHLLFTPKEEFTIPKFL